MEWSIDDVKIGGKTWKTQTVMPISAKAVAIADQMLIFNKYLFLTAQFAGRIVDLKRSLLRNENFFADGTKNYRKINFLNW